MQKVLVLSFVTQDAKKYTITIKNPKDDLNHEIINQTANKIISTKVFDTSKRVLKELKKAAYVSKQETVIE